MKTYADIVGDGGSDVDGQSSALAEIMRARLEDVGHIVAIMSGKGGVGKSTLAVNLAGVMARHGAEVGLVDADINGPSVARMTGVRERGARRGRKGMVPVRAAGGLQIMSMDLFLDDETSPVVWDAPTQLDAYAWRGLREAGALRELIADTDWGKLDYLFVDLPPGADKLPNLANILPQLDGAIVITIPSAVSMAAVAKSIRMTREHLSVDILGLVENMSAQACPNCGHVDDLFPAGDVARLAAELHVPLLARVPFDPLAARCADAGTIFAAEYPGRPAALAIAGLAEFVQDAFAIKS